MSPLNPLIPAIAILLAVLPLLVFWMRMFQDMLNNDRLPSLMTPNAKSDWTIIFIVLNVFAAAMYYAQVYRNRR